jgi:hypothetical protein
MAPATDKELHASPIPQSLATDVIFTSKHVATRIHPSADLDCAVGGSAAARHYY